MNLKQIFQYQPDNSYHFTLTPNNSTSNKESQTKQQIYPNIDLNLKYIQNIYHSSINSDIMIREFALTARNTRLQSIFNLY